MLFSLLTVIESLAVFDVVVHGLKDFNRLCHYCPVKAGKSVFEIVET